MSRRIPVTVIAGGQGSGKTAVLNGWDSNAELADAVVLSHSLAGLSYQRAYQVNESVYVHEAGCLCCAVRGDLVLTLQRLFMDALHRKIPVFSRIVIEASARAEPATFKYLVEYERFLADRYVYAGCLAVVDATHRLPVVPAADALAASGFGFTRRMNVADANTKAPAGAGENIGRDKDTMIDDRASDSRVGVSMATRANDQVALSQIRSADVLLLTNTDQASPSQLAQARELLRSLNPGAVCHSVQTLPDLARLFEVG